MVAPIHLGLDSLLTMNVFESLFWMGAALIVLKIFNGASPKLWLLFGVVCGVGLLNKHSTLFFGFGLFVGLLFTKQRKQLREPWLWLGALITLMIFLPNLLWQLHRDFPIIQLLRNVQRSGRNTEFGPLMFMAVQAMILHPLATPVWIAGLVDLLRDRDGKGYRALGITWIVIMVCMLTMHGRMYYPAPAFPMLTVDQYIAYSRFWHFEPPRIENHRMGPLPQIYADQFGWKEMAQVVADAYYKLPAEERKNCAIFGQNYGQAGAIDFFGAKMGLPPAISGHQSYFYWGPRGFTGACMIVMGDEYKTLSQKFD